MQTVTSCNAFILSRNLRVDAAAFGKHLPPLFALSVLVADMNPLRDVVGAFRLTYELVELATSEPFATEPLEFRQPSIHRYDVGRKADAVG